MTTDLKRAGRALRAARMIERDAYETARLAALEAAADGTTEVEIAQVLGVNRMTVRKWRGKR